VDSLGNLISLVAKPDKQGPPPAVENLSSRPESTAPAVFSTSATPSDWAEKTPLDSLSKAFGQEKALQGHRTADQSESGSRIQAKKHG